MIQVTMEFATAAEAAIALDALGKIFSKVAAPKAGMVAVGSSGPVSETGIAPSAAATTRTRKPRNDAGKARGPYKNAAPQGKPDSETVTHSPESNPAVAAPINAAPPGQPEADAHKAKVTEPSAPAGAAPTPEQAQAVFAKVFEDKGMGTARDLLARYGVKRVLDVPADMRAEFVAHAQEVLKGGAA